MLDDKTIITETQASLGAQPSEDPRPVTQETVENLVRIIRDKKGQSALNDFYRNTYEHFEKEREVARAQRMRQTSFSGSDTRVYVAGQRAEEIQGISFQEVVNPDGHVECFGDMLVIQLDEPPLHVGSSFQYMGMVAVNEYGKKVVIGVFQDVTILGTNWGVDANTTASMVGYRWVGTRLANDDAEKLMNAWLNTEQRKLQLAFMAQGEHNGEPEETSQED